MLRKLILVLCLFGVVATLSAGCHAGVETKKGHGAHVDVG
jgi:hypothetical protein